jgi:quercetin dioxygenase-like cupin family protein
LETWDVRSLDVEPSKPQVLRSEPAGRAIAINLPAGEELRDHRVHEHAWIIVADGEVELQVPGGETVRGGPGLIAHTEPGETHEVRAVSDARLLLLLIPWPGEGHPSLTAEDRASA